MARGPVSDFTEMIRHLGGRADRSQSVLKLAHNAKKKQSGENRHESLLYCVQSKEPEHANDERQETQCDEG